MCSHLRVILHLAAEFRSNQTNDGVVMMSYRFFFQDGGNSVGNLLPGSGLVTALI